MNPICPIHKTPLAPCKTQYGLRYACKNEDCTVVWWKTGSPSTPADLVTRQARQDAHLYFDRWWKENNIKRADAYEKLSKHLGISKAQTHIGLFTGEQCRMIVDFVKIQRKVTDDNISKP